MHPGRLVEDKTARYEVCDEGHGQSGYDPLLQWRLVRIHGGLYVDDPVGHDGAGNCMKSAYYKTQKMTNTRTHRSK
jgi:hypothetical protein